MQNTLVRTAPSLMENHDFSHTQEMQEVEGITEELRRLVSRHKSSCDEADLRQEVEILEYWMQSYWQGLAAAHKIAGSGIEWLAKIRDRLKLSAEEMQRLESEGGNLANKEQAVKIEELLRTVRLMDKVIPDIEHMFAKPQ